LLFSISLETLCGSTDLFLPVDSNLLIMILLAKGSQELAHCICEILSLELNTEELKKFRELAITKLT
jgi:hypothetical protein